MGLICPELSLDLKPTYVSQTINGFLKQLSMIGNVSERLDELDDFVRRLEDEMCKIQVFKRELPLCMLLLKDAILVLKQEVTEFKTKNAHQPVLEEFIPLKKESCFETTQNTKQEASGRDKKNWMSSVQLWTPNSPNKIHTQPLALDTPKADDKLTSKIRCGDDVPHECDPSKNRPEANEFLPMMHTYPTFPEMRRTVDKEDASVPGLSLLVPGLIKHPKDHESISRPLGSKLAGARICSSSSPASNGRPSHALPTSRKQRRCWSPELHRRFVDALTQLGGPQVATPKQIRELMRVDGLTNDEVKSHLQKYRLHTRRVPNNSTASANETGNGLTGSWATQDQYSESSKPSSSQCGSPEGPLQFPGRTTTGGDSMEDDDEEEKSES